jgi:RNA polymerase sigma-70 factor (ECF subfamily)
MSKDENNVCNENTFENIYNTYAKNIRQFLFYKTQNIEKAEDLMQDVFVKLWDNCKTVNLLTIKSFLFTIANNLFLNDYKHSKVVRNYKNLPKENKEIQTPEFIIIEKEFSEKLKLTISSLPEKQKEVFLLNRIEKKKYKEIALMLNISVKAVEKRMHLALLKMRSEIGDV